MAQRISELQRLRNELAQLKSPTQDNLSQSDINISKDSAQKNTGSGFGYTLGKLWGGIVRSHEGWFDAAIAQAADVFGNDELAERVMKNDWMDYGKYDAKFNPGKGWEFTGDVASGVGNLLPAIALSFVPVAGAGLSQGWFTQSASGQAVSDAVKQTGELGNKEWAYGAASGLLEGAIERLSGGIGGTALFKDIGKKAGKTVLGKLAVNMAGEGAEEVASDIIDPILKRTTGVDNEAQMPTFGELGRTFAVGGVTGAVMGGGTTALQAARVGGFNNLNAINDSNELVERQADNNLRQVKGKKALYTEEDINRTKESLSKRLKKMDDTTRAEFLKRNARVAQMFNEDGTVKDFAPAPETYNEGTYSASLKGREGSFAYKPVADTSAISQEAKQVMNTLTKITGGNTNIVLTEDALTTESGKSANGLYQDGVIYLNAKATDYDKALKVGIHEVVHGLEGTKEYNELAKYISQQIKNDPDLAQRYNIDAYRNAYDKLLKGEWTEDTKDYQAATEIFADYIGNVVAENKTLLNNLVARNSNVFVRFLNWVRNSIAKLGESAEERKMRKDLQTLEKMLVEALQAGNGGITLEEVEDLARTAEKARKTQDGNVQSVKFEENKNADGKLATARFSTDLTFAEQVDAVLAGTDVQSSHLQVRANTPKILLDVGLSDKPMLITSVHTKTAVGKEVKNKNIHNIDVGVFKDLPKLLENPAIIMDSTKQNSIVVFVDAVDNAKNPIMCAINIQGKGFYNSVEIDTNLVSSVYGKDTNPIGFIEKSVNDNRVLYWDKKMSQALFEIPGLQLPDNLNRLSSNVIIRKTNVLVNSFSQNSSKKVEKTSTSRKSIDVDSEGNSLTAEQMEYFKDSKVRDKDGNLLVVYHGTRKADFTEFKRNINFFTDSEEMADSYAPSSEKYIGYLNIENPFVIDANGERWSRIPIDAKTKAFLEKYGASTFKENGKWRTSPADIASAIESGIDEGELDYDGIIIKNIDDTGRYWKTRDNIVANDYITFKSNQFKNTTNKTPTKNADIRYSIDVDGKNIGGNGEVTKNLVALHNLSESNLLRVIGLGGFPMPSIAVTTTELPHENYGDITVVFGRETIDPESDSRNVVYDRDAWTPTTPTVDVKLSNQKVDSLIKNLQGDVGDNSTYKRSIFSFFDGKYRDNNGDYVVPEYDYTREQFGERAIRNSGIVAAYLSEKGVKVEPVYTERGFTMGWASFTRKEAADLFDFVGITEDVTRDNATQEQRDAILEKYIEYQAKKKLSLFRRFNKNPNLTVEDAVESIRKDYDDGNVSQLFFMAEDFFNKNRPKDIYDEQATIDKMQNAITDKQDFYDWFWDKIEATFEKKGIDNDSDVFDRRGNRRSFEQRHFAYTASNIVKAMAKGEQEGKAGFGITAGALAAKLSKRFESIEDIHEAKEYLALVSEDDLKAFNDKTYELYDELVTAIAGKSSDFLSDSHRRDGVGDILGKCAGAKPLTVENIKRIFDRETRGYNLGYKFNNDIAEQTLLLFESLKHIPITYFESKPRRVVALNEIKNVLIPQGASENLVKALKAKHIPYTEYNEWESRSSIIKNMDNARFSIDVDLDNKTTARVQTVVSDEKLTLKERWENTVEKLKEGKADQWIKAQIAWTDEQAGIIAAGRNLGIVVHGEVQRARTAKASAVNMLNDSQRDYSGKKRVGDSLKAIFKPIQSRGKKVAQAFNLYLLHQLNVDRMSAEETAIAKRKELLKKSPDLDNAVNGRYANDAEWQSAVKSVDGGKEYLATFDVENKPVFEKDVDKAFSLEKVQQLEKQYPEFKATAEKVWKYSQNLLQYRVDAGLITQAQADQMTKMYPHYVPAFYEKNGGGTSGAFVGQKGVAVKTGIKSAKGSTGVSNIEDVQTSIARQTVAVIRAASINKIIEKLYDGAMKTKNFVDFEIVGKESMTDPDVNYDTDIPKENQVFFYKDGERITLDVSQYIYAGFRGLTAGAQMSDPITTLSSKGINLFKKLVTSWNPLFAVTNAVRDAQEALFYTKYGKRFFANYGKALVTRKSDPRLKELWEQYKAMGGTGSGYFSRDTGVFDDRSKLRKGVEWLGDKMQIVNEWVEQAPRFAEFVASVEAGNSLEQALYDSAEVTTNFSRGGKMAKALNRHLIPFLNPSIQGWSKMWRGWVAPMDGKSAAEIERLSKQSKGRRFLSNYGALMFKAILCGVSVGLFNDMLYRWIDDDEDYANLPLNIKENYYLIKVGKKFIKIPKGRVVALYGSAWTRLSEAMNGNEDALNAWDWAKSASEMVSPLESAFRSIIAPVRDVQTNTTWYGGQIENASMENLAPSERYDEGTSKIAIAMGKAFNYSPKKIHYILDQYSGVIGDVILPLTTNKAEKNMVSARFVVDPLYNSDVSTKYYDYKEELTFAKNSGDTNAKLMLKYMNEVQDDLSKMYQQKRDIANDKSLTNKEKREQTEIIQGLINATLSSSVDMADEFEQTLIDNQYEQAVAVLMSSKAYTKLDEKSQTYASNKMNEYYYEMCKAEVSGTKPSMKYALYTSMNAPDLVVYLSNINNIEADKDKKGNTISGSRKEKVHKYIQGLRLSVQQKNILMYLAGYKPTDAGQKTVEAYLTKQGYTAKEVDELWI